MTGKQVWMAVVVGVMVAGAACAAPLDGQFVLVGSSAQGTFNGSAFVETNPYDIYEFRVTNNTGQAIFSFQDVAISADLLQVGGKKAQVGTALAVDAFNDYIPGDQFTPDSFFTDDRVEPSMFGNTSDSGSELSAESIATLGEAWLADGATETIAVLSVSAGSSIPTLVSGGATTGSVVTAITVVPEPVSVVLLGMGGLCLLRRRAAA